MNDMTREQAVQSLVRLDRPLPLLKDALAGYPWDWEAPPLRTLDGQAVAAILRRYETGELSAEQVEAWANLIEVRDDIELDATAADAIFCLANPLINGPLETVAPMLLKRL
jgi:hypothetical protein